MAYGPIWEATGRKYNVTIELFEGGAQTQCAA